MLRALHESVNVCTRSRNLQYCMYPPVPLMPDLVYQYSCTRILDLQYSTVVLGSYTAVQHRSYCITVLAVRILLYELYSTVLYCTTSMDGAKAELMAQKQNSAFAP